MEDEMKLSLIVNSFLIFLLAYSHAVTGHAAEWVQVNAGPRWSSRTEHASVVFQDKIWVLGGLNKGISNGNLNDVWSSPDGVNWTQVTAAAAWEPRSRHSALVYDGKLWVLGGYGNNGTLHDVWYSSDGAA
jgi:leucine-zipper-like transcriptional regulator 1